MDERIRILSDLTLKGEMYPQSVKTEFDRSDILLPRIEREAKRLCEYMRSQKPLLNEYCTMTGLMIFDGSVVGPAFTLSGYPETAKVMDAFYLKQIDNISVMEWQHASGEYKKVLSKGVLGLIDDIDASLAAHDKPEEIEFLRALRDVAQAVIDWGAVCARDTAAFAMTVQNPDHRANLEKMARAFEYVPAHAPRTFYEALLTMYVCFSFNPDSFGTLDRYLNDFYEKDLADGTLTEAQAKTYLQEFLLLPQAFNSLSMHSTKGGQSHFCVGGRLADGRDGFRPITRLIIDSLMELPICIPEITFRWTSDTPREVLRYVMDCERHDPYKRIAFTNDEKRLKCLTENCGIPYEKAVEYTMCGCNELVFPGSIIASTSKGNLMRCIETLFHKKSEEIAGSKTFDDFYALFEKELYSDLDIICDYDDKYNLGRARDYSYVSSLFFNDCIENATSLTQGGGNTAVSSPMLLGVVNVIDSLIAVKQLVFDEQIITLRELTKALNANWAGYEDFRTLLLRKVSFFGNDDERSNEVARRFYHSMYRYMTAKRTVFGYPYNFGDHTGYHEHFKWFGEDTAATPDGRRAGDPLKIGLSQSEGRDHSGLTALLNSIAQADPDAIACGSTVTNITLEETLIRDDATFEHTVELFETYLRSGGVHFQLNYVTKEELLDAKRCPEEHRNLRVRVTGFSEYFTKLQSAVQDNIIERTQQH